MAVSTAMVAGDDGALFGADGGMSFEAGRAGEERASGEDIEEAVLTGAAGDDAPDIGGCAAFMSHDGHTVTISETRDVTVGAEDKTMSDGAEGATAFAVPADGTFTLREAVPVDSTLVTLVSAELCGTEVLACADGPLFAADG